MGKPRGSYVTLTAPHMAGSDPEIDKRCAKALAKQIRAMMPKKNKQRPVLLVGLGNRSMTPDSLGRDAGSCDGDAAFVFALAERICKRQAMFAPYRPAFWETGIESSEAVFGIVQQSKSQRWSSRWIHWQQGTRRRTWQPLYSLAIPALRREAAWATDGWPWMKDAGRAGTGVGRAVGGACDTLFEGRQQGVDCYPKDIDGIVKVSAMLLSRASTRRCIPDCPKR